MVTVDRGGVLPSTASAAVSNCSRHMARDSSVSSSAPSNPFSRANNAAPSPTSRQCCGSRSITARATEIGLGNPRSAPTAPNLRSEPVITEASSSTTPCALGSPPVPT